MLGSCLKKGLTHYDNLPKPRIPSENLHDLPPCEQITKTKDTPFTQKAHEKPVTRVMVQKS